LLSLALWHLADVGASRCHFPWLGSRWHRSHLWATKAVRVFGSGLLRQLVGGTPDAGLVLDDDVMNLKGDWQFSAQNRPEGWNVWLTFSLSSAPSASPPPAVH
jgi:hypothetical protein